MKLKLNKDGSAVVRDGKPVYTHADGREEAFDAAGAMKILVGKHFEASPVMAGLKIPHDVAAAAFGDSFRIKDCKLVAIDKGGIPVYSHVRHGEVANFDEALSQLVARYPNKDMILKTDGAPAPGQQGLASTTITRAQFDALPQQGRSTFFQQGGRLSDGPSAAAPGAPVAPAASTGKVITRAQLSATPPAQAAAFFKAGGKVVD